MTEESQDQINFHYEDIDFSIKESNLFHEWLTQIISVNKVELEVINYIFCSDDYLLNINRTYLNHDYYTDIISFPYREAPEPIQGDVFISIDRVRENANINQVNFENELLRVMAHGLLHFIGYTDKSEEEQAIMRKKEDEMMALYRL